jgi:hypothetical protein
MVQRVGGEEQESPSATDGRVREKTIALLLLEKNAAAKKHKGHRIRQPDFAPRAEFAERLNPEVGDAKHDEDDADLVQPISAQYFFQREYRLHALLRGWPGCR